MFCPALSDTKRSWQVSAGEGGTCARGLRILTIDAFDDHYLSFESAGAPELVNEHSGFAVAPAHYIAFAELELARPVALL